MAEIQKVETALAEVAKLLDDRVERLPLPSKADACQFLNSVAYMLKAKPGLLECTRRSLFGCVYSTAILRLSVEPSLGQVYFVPFRNKGVKEAQLIIGYRGYSNLMYRSARTASVTACTVHEKDEFDYALGDKAFIHHKPPRGLSQQDRGPGIAAYFIGRLIGSPDPVRHVMEAPDILSIKNRSKSGSKPDSPWMHPTDWTWMWAKCPLLVAARRFMPISLEEPDLGRALVIEAAQDGEKPASIVDLVPPEVIGDVPEYGNALPPAGGVVYPDGACQSCGAADQPKGKPCTSCGETP